MRSALKLAAFTAAATVTAAAVSLDAVCARAIDGRVTPRFHKQTLPELAARTKAVNIKSFDGLTLAGRLLEVKDAKRLVIAAHGWRSGWQHDFHEQAAILERLGCSVLFIDQRAHGRSGGRYICFGAKERFDIISWLRFSEKEFSLPVYLMGVSMGATSVMLASELTDRSHVKGAIADCGFTSAGDIWRYNIENRAPYGAAAIYRALDRRCCAAAGFHGDDRSTAQALANTDIPFLFIHGGGDRFVPTQMSIESHAACASDKRLIIVPGAKHGRSCLVDPQGYERALTEFFKEHK